MKLQPVVLGGLFIGVLSSLPVVNAGNCCCCLWVVLGGILTVYLLQKDAGVPIDAGQGALYGAAAGVLGGILTAIAGLLIQQLIPGAGYEEAIQAMLADENMPPEARAMIERMSDGRMMMVVIAFLNVISSTVFGLIGGLLGVAIFKKNVPPPPPPQPPPVTVIPHDPGAAQ